jgi:hypothetical protein
MKEEENQERNKNNQISATRSMGNDRGNSNREIEEMRAL